MTACLHYTPERDAKLMQLARQIGDAVRAHRHHLELSQSAYERRYGIGRIGHIEANRVPNFTVLMLVKLLEITGAGELQVVAKDGAR